MRQASSKRPHYYGWWITGSLAITETLSYGILYYAFSVFLVPMQNDLGWSRVSLTGAFSLALLVSGLAAPFAGRWLDRHGPRGLMTAGSMLATALLFGWSRVESRPVYYLIWVGLGLAMAATLYEPAFATVAKWFARDRAKALLALTVVAGFASTIFLPLANGLIQAHGWRTAIVILAGIFGVGTIPLHALVLRRRPEDLGLYPDGVPPAAPDAQETASGPDVPLHDAVRDPSLWWLTGSLCLATLTTVAVSVHLVPYIETRGNSAGFAAVVAGSLGAFSVGGRILVTIALRWLSEIHATAAIFGLQSVALIVLLVARVPAGIVIFAALFGAGNGAVTLARAGLIADLYGRAAYGAINGVVALFVTLARAIAPVGAGLAYSWAGDYDPVFAGLILLTGGAMLATIGAERAHRRRPDPAWASRQQIDRRAEGG